MTPATDYEQSDRLRAWPGGSAIRVTGEDDLRLTVLNSLAGVTVTLRGRVLTCQGELVPFEQRLTPTTDRQASTTLSRLAEGWLVQAHAFVSAGAPLTGQTFAMLSVVRGEGSAALDLFTLASGYITNTQRITYPAGSLQNSTEGGGAIRSITGTAPAVGAEVSEVVPIDCRWELLTFAVVLTTSAAVANRTPQLVIDDGAIVLNQTPSLFTQAASLATRHQWGAGQPYSAIVNALATPSGLPVRAVLTAGFHIKTLTNLLQAGDQYGAPQYLVREWIEGA